MPLTPVRLRDQGGNQILQSIVSGQNISLTRALSDSVQMTRDNTSNQLAQENAFLGQRRFDRSFRERQFQDRRDFDRGVFERDRGFGEGQRQFNIRVLENNADRDLRARLGYGRLGLDRDRLEFSEERANVADELALGRNAREQAEFEDERQRKFRARELEDRLVIAQDPQAFLASRPDLQGSSSEELAAARERELQEIRTRTVSLREPTAAVAEGESAEVGAAVELTPRDQQALSVGSQADRALEAGDFDSASTFLSEAIVTAQPGSPAYAQLITRKSNLDADLAARREGSSISREAAFEAAEIYNNNVESAFASGRLTYLQELEAARTSRTRNEFIEANLPETINGRPATNAQLDAVRKTRGEFYDNAVSTSQRDAQTAASTGDPLAGILDFETRE